MRFPVSGSPRQTIVAEIGLEQRPGTRVRRGGRLGRGTSRPGLHPAGRAVAQRYIESFNGRVRGECLNIKLFWSLTQAKAIISDWKEEYNHHRHSSLGYLTRTEYASACIDSRLSSTTDQFLGSRQHQVQWSVLTEWLG